MADAPAESTRYYINSWSARTGQRIFARLIDSAIALGVIAAVIVGGPHGRPLAQDLLIVGFISSLEVALLAKSGATLGMSAIGIRVAPLDRTGRPDWLNAARRTLPVALCYAVLPPGLLLSLLMPGALLVSMSSSPNRRAFNDRASGTVVVQADAPSLISTADLERWWQPGQEPVLSRWGRVPGVSDRRRARAHRLDGLMPLAATIALAGIVLIGLGGTWRVWLGLTVAWIVAMIVDETRCTAREGANPGHRHFGYRVVDMTTGEPPTMGRAFLRSLVLIPLITVPPLQVILVLWVHGSSHNRGPHDLIAHTMVVESDFQAPQFLPGTAMPSPWLVPYPPVGSTFFPPPSLPGPIAPPPPPPASPLPPPPVPGPF